MFELQNLVCIRTSQKISKIFGRMSGRRAPHCFTLARSSNEQDALCAHGARKKGSALKVPDSCCSAPSRPAGLSAPHVLSPPKDALPPANLGSRAPAWLVLHQGGADRTAPGRPAGLAPALLYKTRRQRHFSVHQRLRFACLIQSSSISSPFLKSLCLIKLF
jgi:hypothetical protein